jgi:hypothetical protein
MTKKKSKKTVFLNDGQPRRRAEFSTPDSLVAVIKSTVKLAGGTSRMGRKPGKMCRFS